VLLSNETVSEFGRSGGGSGRGSGRGAWRGAVSCCESESGTLLSEQMCAIWMSNYAIPKSSAPRHSDWRSNDSPSTRWNESHCPCTSGVSPVTCAVRRLGQSVAVAGREML
jgi:hypothetical protein